MKKYIFAVFFILFSFAATYAQKGTWTHFSSTAGRFKVVMPTAPKDISNDGPPQPGPQPHLFRAYSPNAVYVVAWVDEDPNIPFNVRWEINETQKPILSGKRALSEYDITLKGNPGIEFTTENDKQIITCRIYVVGKRIYLLTVAVDRGSREDIGRRTFFESFELAG